MIVGFFDAEICNPWICQETGFHREFFQSELLLYNHGFNYILFELIVFMAYQELVTVLYSSSGGGGAQSRLVFRISVSRFLCSRLHFDSGLVVR